MSKAVYRCTDGMVCGANGRRYHFAPGDLVFEDHPINPKRSPFFEEVSEYVERTTARSGRAGRADPVVEEATAEPGEKRWRGWPTGTKDKPGPVPADAPKLPESPDKGKPAPATQKDKAAPAPHKEPASSGPHKEQASDGQE